MQMEQKEYAEISAKIKELTPSLITDTTNMLRQDPEMARRYGSNLYDIAQQGVVTLSDLLLAALEFDHPQIVGSELVWLQNLHRSRQVRPEILEESMKLYRNSLSQNLPEAYAGRVLAMFDQVIAQFYNMPVNLRSS